MSQQSLVGVDYQNQPNFDAWWTPGWSSQNQSYLPVPPNVFGEPGFPSTAKYVTLTGNFFDGDGNPLSGYFTFWPSSSVTFNVSGVTTVIPQRFVGTNFTMLGINQYGSGRVYLWNGQLLVNLLATDNANMTPATFTYHVKENFFEGLEYDITVPSADANINVDIHSLIVPGSIIADDDTTISTFRIASVSTQNLSIDITSTAGSLNLNPTAYPVKFAFMTTTAQPTSGNFVAGVWATTGAPYVAQILIGPANGGLVLATGTYSVWIEVVTPAQVPVFQVGQLTIF